jgi:hypothetical protein
MGFEMSVTDDASLTPSPQVMLHVHGASAAPPGSVTATFTVAGAPCATTMSVPALTVGGTFAIVTVAVAGALVAPNASVTTSVAV